MSDVIMIEPRTQELGNGVVAREIQLGGTPRGLVVLLTDATVADGEVVEVMNNLAVEGLETLAVPAGPGVADLVEARAAVRDWYGDQVGVVGIGEGATAALEMAQRRRLGAVVGISPAPDVAAVEADPALLTPWLGLLGEDAADLSAAEVSRLRRALDRGSDVHSQVVVYPGVGADFHRRSEDGVSFAASYDGWQRTVEWLLARVAPRLTPLALAWRERQAS
ncbi:dienelactone hydrolase family protein [Nocardioides sp. J9]|uniref:dienelactone hydrolase family protein n=1 Tax=unclassified Nocardioides TaxID=2615069 RepID=UPI00048B7A6E|nr:MULTISPECIES: dienelactone hydrolase family protein [unclassified Nocardioides]TWH00856.1 dienelactone hydrolase family protein [Nocardioides sp. J9]